MMDFGEAQHEIPVEISLSSLETEDGVLVSSAIRDITGLCLAKILSGPIHAGISVRGATK